MPSSGLDPETLLLTIECSITLLLRWILKWTINLSEDSNDDDYGGGILIPDFQGN